MKEANRDIYFNKGHLNEEALALFVDALLLNKEDRLPSLIRDHVEDCQHCKLEAFSLYEVMKSDSGIQNTHTHPFFDGPKMNEKKPFQLYNLLKVAAAMLLIITVIGSIVYNVSNKQKKSGVVSNVLDTINKQKGNNISANSGKEEKDSSLQKNSKDGTSKAISSTPLAANVQKSELFESLIASNYRSNDVEVSFPSLNHLFHTSQTLVFKITGELSEPVTLNIYNNQGKKVIGKDHILTNSFSVSNKLSPGLYYWKLLKDDDLLQVGKFIVK